ncbi:esterase/lipase family protein [Kribbella qitaiheensis]|uniref:esterase/lipase family protein n=1 Tax=Kribbella qitaiheensis TaxID=1544730 RepID=UPI003611B87E
MKDVVVVLPGITGSRLQKDGADVWSISAGGVARALVTFGRSIKQLAMEDDDPEAEYLDDGVRDAGMLADIHLLPGLWRIDGYSKICDTLLRQFELVEGANFFRFAYDWRRDNRAHAKRLDRQSRQWLRNWRESSGNAEAKLVLIAHSMGGLVARYFLECREGWRETRSLITFGTPYSGSLNAVDTLVNGWRRSIGPLELLDLGETLRTFPAVYQLLPIHQCIDLGDGALHRLADIKPALPGMNGELVTNALRFHREIEDAVTSHRQDDYEGTGGYDIRPIIGEFQATNQSAVIEGQTARLLPDRAGVDEGGDGTVPRLSSVPKELFTSQRNVMYAAYRHAALQNADPVLTHVYGLMRGAPPDPGQFFAGLARLGMGIADIHDETTPIPLQVRCDVAGTSVRAAAVDIATGTTAASITIDEVGEDWIVTELPPLPAGDYRITLAGGADVIPIADVFTVLGRPTVIPSE